MITELWATLLANLQALSMAQRSAHWCAMGEQSYSDHLLYERMYDATAKEADAVAERLLGLTGDASVLDPAKLLMMATAAVRALVIPGDPAASMLMAERKFLEQASMMCQALEGLCQLSGGAENLIQGIMDRHEEHVYLLSRRTGAAMLQACIRAVPAAGAGK